MVGRSGVFDFPAFPGMRMVMSVDESGAVVECYAAQCEIFDESESDRMRARLAAWNTNQRALKLLG